MPTVDRWPPHVRAAFTVVSHPATGDDTLACNCCGGQVKHPNQDPAPATLRWMAQHARQCRDASTHDKAKLR